jgi:F-type H+-transporting ATPase subunit alpha
MLNRGARLTELLKQNQYSPLKIEEQVISIYAGVNGYLDRLAVSDVLRFEDGLLRFMRESHAGVLSAIRTEGEISSATGDTLKAAVDEFAAKFA